MTAIGIVGLGLVGGSLARALRARADRPRIVAVDARVEVREAARARGLVDEIDEVPGDALAGCETVVLAAPVGAIEQLLGPVAARMRDGAVLTDVAGVKTAIVEAARRAVRPGVAFVGAHPMFGGERGGIDAAREDAWRGGVVAVCEDHAPAWAIEQVEALHASLGARVVRCAADAHDRAVALVSHLPYVTASALAGLADAREQLARDLAGRGFADATRLAGFAYEVQGEVARRNPHLAEAIDALVERLEAIREALAEGPEEARRALERKPRLP